MGFSDWLYTQLHGYDKETGALLWQLRETLDTDDYSELKTGVSTGKAKLSVKTIDVPGVHQSFVHITGKAYEELNRTISERAYHEAFEAFAPHAFKAYSEAIAPEILDRESVKQAVALQLFADERMHILLLGDPGTGKTEILRGSANLAPKSSMGLGSGTSKAGLSVAYAKGEMQLGLLPMADKGICCIDELNLMATDDRASLYNAMEKGFITYDKGGKHEKFSADVRVLATANPKGDKFDGGTPAKLKKQLPFAPALLSRFHIVFLVLRPDEEQFVDIARKIVRGTPKKDSHEFLTAYIAHATKQDVRFPKRLEKRVTDAARAIKRKEKQLLIEVSPRIVKGIIGFSKASARCELRGTVKESDVERVLTILGDSLGLAL